MTVDGDGVAAGWHAMSSSDVATALGADLASGLSDEEARRRLNQYGPNRLPRQARLQEQSGEDDPEDLM